MPTKGVLSRINHEMSSHYAFLCWFFLCYRPDFLELPILYHIMMRAWPWLHDYGVNATNARSVCSLCSSNSSRIDFLVCSLSPTRIAVFSSRPTFPVSQKIASFCYRTKPGHNTGKYVSWDGGPWPLSIWGMTWLISSWRRDRVKFAGWEISLGLLRSNGVAHNRVIPTWKKKMIS